MYRKTNIIIIIKGVTTARGPWPGPEYPSILPYSWLSIHNINNLGSCKVKKCLDAMSDDEMR